MTKRITKADALRALAEALEAVNAFEHYCVTYREHGLSPRLKKWREGVCDMTRSTKQFKELTGEIK